MKFIYIFFAIEITYLLIRIAEICLILYSFIQISPFSFTAGHKPLVDYTTPNHFSLFSSSLIRYAWYYPLILLVVTLWKVSWRGCHSRFLLVQRPSNVLAICPTQCYFSWVIILTASPNLFVWSSIPNVTRCIARCVIGIFLIVFIINVKDLAL